MNARIDEGAAEAGRSPDDIRRGFNLMGMIDVGQVVGRPANLDAGVIYGRPGDWLEELTRLYHDYRQDTFLFWPVGPQPLKQLEAFAKEVAPAVKAALAAPQSP
jgi:alkanesulfonate monooxygenase SsuD/methylene tetrahydromethanopterin reductase-like flavin-dependent oxidoreductase (luciferase family)